MLRQILICVIFNLLLGCAQTPNNITITNTQGACLTGGVDASPVNNPSNAPYCMSITLQNNNIGENANNVQVTNSGITLSYQAITSSGLQTYANAICDNNASGGVCTSTNTGTNQIGNITVYDPNNCATQQGSRVSTLMASGGTCTFYLQLSGETYAFGSYPITVTYNYTNSNQNFSITNSFYEKVQLYSGGEFGLYQINNSTFNFIESGIQTKAVVHDFVGRLFFNSNNVVYMFNGANTTQVGNQLSSNVNSMTIDGNNNLIVSTASNGLFSYPLQNILGGTWSAITDQNNLVTPTSNTIGVAGSQLSNMLYVINSTNAYRCLETGTSLITLNCNNIGSGSTFYPNSLAMSSSGVLYTGNNNTLEFYIPSAVGDIYTFSPTLGANYVSSVNVNNNNIVAGIHNTSPYLANGLYSCGLTGGNCLPVPSSSTGNYIMGNLTGVAMDGAGYVFGVGDHISSNDFSGTKNGFFSNILFNTATSLVTFTWAPTINQINSLNSPVVVSTLHN